MNFGAMLHLVGKLNEAEDEYLTALTLSTSDHNKNESAEMSEGFRTIQVNLLRLHNIMKSRGLPIRKVVGVDD